MRTFSINLILIISIIIFIVIYAKHHSNLKSNGQISYFVPIIVFVVSIIINNLLPEKNLQDYLTTNRPYLEPSLIIEKDVNDNYFCKFEIINNGNFPAEELEFIYITPLFKGAELPFIKNKQLGPNSTMILPFVHNPLDIDDESVYKFSLIILYNSKIKKKTINYKSTFDFMLFDNNLKDGKYIYNSSIREENKMSTDEQIEYIDIKNALEKQEGTITFWVDINKMEKSMPTIISRSLNKIFLWDPSIQSFLIQYLNNENKYFSYRFQIEGELTDLYFVALTWDKSNMTLYIKE
ncbi:MAG: hypothetical protein ISS28_01860 [Candidatus Cloacimonetes bacterium]|nr:hypothetical protein [Candidatus Cloacimonadota bacterium]